MRLTKDDCTNLDAKMRLDNVMAEVQSLLAQLDELADTCADESVFCLCRDRLRKLLEVSATTVKSDYVPTYAACPDHWAECNMARKIAWPDHTDGNQNES